MVRCIDDMRDLFRNDLSLLRRMAAFGCHRGVEGGDDREAQEKRVGETHFRGLLIALSGSARAVSIRTHLPDQQPICYEIDEERETAERKLDSRREPARVERPQ